MSLIEEKANLIEKINEAKNVYIDANIEYKTEKCKLLLTTDFTKELDKSRPTVDEKNAYVDFKTIELRKKKEMFYNNIKYLEMLLDLTDSKISLES